MKSLFAARSAMADAAHASLEFAREIRAGVDLSPSSSADKQALETATLAFRRGDDGKCVPNESFLICVEKTGGLPDSPIFLAARVVTSNGNLKGARAHTLSARRHDGAIDVAWSASTSRSSGHHVFCAKFDLRCVPAEGDVLSIETFVGSDTSQKSSSWGNAYARGVLSLQVLMSTTEVIRVPLHKNLRKTNGDADAFVEVRVVGAGGVEGVAAGVISGVVTPQPTPQHTPQHTPQPPQTDLLGSLIDLDIGVSGGAHSSSLSAMEPSGTTSQLVHANKSKNAVRIFFIRHGESKWNEAQREMLLSKMAKFDHPLTCGGVVQALDSGARAKQCVAKAYARGSQRTNESYSRQTTNEATTNADWWRSFALAKHCFVSPLTRAVQTAALFLGEHALLGAASSSVGSFFADNAGAEKSTATPDENCTAKFSYGPGVGSVVLSRHIREVKSGMGSLDTIGIEKGLAILRRAKEKTNECLCGSSTTIDLAARRIQSELFHEKFATKVSLGDAFGAWWTPRDSLETKEEVDERVDLFLEQVRLTVLGTETDKKNDVNEARATTSDESIVLVGHSLWFARVMKRLLQRVGSAGFREKHPGLAQQLGTQKIPNCAVVGIDLRFDNDTGTPAISDAAFLFGSAGDGSETPKDSANGTDP